MTADESPRMRSSLDARGYYDAHVTGKLRDFIHGNRRVDAAVERVLHTAESPRRVLEVGCGIGHVADRVAQAWPEAEIVGVDTSPHSIEVARKLFASERVTFHEGLLEELHLTGPFDLVVMMDMLEHVPVPSRGKLLAELRRLVQPSSRVVVTVPTPEFLSWLRENRPDNIQPVDENITAHVLTDVAEELGLSVLLYERVSIWRRFDYAHAVLGGSAIAELDARPSSPPSPRGRWRLRRDNLPRTPGPAERAKLVADRLGAEHVPVR